MKFATTLPLLSLLCLAEIGAAAAQSSAGEPVARLSLSADFRLRLDLDTRDGTGVTADSNIRLRPRLRARAGLSYDTPLDGLSFGMRLASNPGTPGNSPHQTLDAFDANVVSIDRAYLAYDPLAMLEEPPAGFDAKLVFGKQRYPNWQQTEIFFDDDIQPEGVLLSADYQVAGVLGTRAGYFYFASEGFTDDLRDNDTYFTWQLHHRGAFGPVSTVAAVTGLHIADGGPLSNTDGMFTPADVSFFMFSAQVAGQPAPQLTLTGGVDVATSSGGDPAMPADNNLAFVVQGRVGYKQLGARYYYYSVEEASVPFYAEASFSQDNFPNTRGGGLTGFRGHRVQLDYEFHQQVAADFRAYFQEGNADNVLSFSEIPGRSTNRYQLNLNVKF